MAFHADAQQALAAAGVVAQLVFGMLELRQQVLRELVEKAARLGQAQAASFFHPQRCADLFFQFARGVAEGGLGEVEGVGSAGQGAVFDDGANQCQV